MSDDCGFDAASWASVTSSSDADRWSEAAPGGWGAVLWNFALAAGVVAASWAVRALGWF